MTRRVSTLADLDSAERAMLRRIAEAEHFEYDYDPRASSTILALAKLRLVGTEAIGGRRTRATLHERGRKLLDGEDLPVRRIVQRTKEERQHVLEDLEKAQLDRLATPGADPFSAPYHPDATSTAALLSRRVLDLAMGERGDDGSRSGGLQGVLDLIEAAREVVDRTRGATDADDEALDSLLSTLDAAGDLLVETSQRLVGLGGAAVWSEGLEAARRSVARSGDRETDAKAMVRLAVADNPRLCTGPKDKRVGRIVEHLFQMANAPDDREIDEDMVAGGDVEPKGATLRNASGKIRGWTATLYHGRSGATRRKPLTATADQLVRAATAHVNKAECE